MASYKSPQFINPHFRPNKLTSRYANSILISTKFQSDKTILLPLLFIAKNIDFLFTNHFFFSSEKIENNTEKIKL